MYCIYCGKEILDQKVCPACGKAQKTANYDLNGEIVTPAPQRPALDAPCVGGFCYVDGSQVPPAKLPGNDRNKSWNNWNTVPTTHENCPLDPPATGGFAPLNIPGPANRPQTHIPPDNSHKNPVKVPIARKKWMVVAVCFIAAICVLTLFVCSGLPNRNSSIQLAEEALDRALETSIRAVNTEGITPPAFLSSIESRNGYEILAFEETDSGAIATMRVFAPDVYGVVKELDLKNTYTDVNVLMYDLDKALQAAPLIERQILLEYVHMEDGYEPVLTAEFVDAYYGGVYRLRNEAIAEAAGMEG